MLRHLKTWSAVLLVAALVQQAGAFTIFGPLESWQLPALSYGTRFWYSPQISTLNQPPSVPGNVPYTEPGGPKNFGAGSRLNVPIITYGFDYTFLDYYGTQGVKAVDAAFAVLNKLPPVSSASANLTEFIQQGNQQINYTARALSMLDLKSVVLQIMMQHMGLLGETHVFDLLGQGGVCGAAWYQVGVRNYDPIYPWNPTTYVNGVNYGYFIEDGCTLGTPFAIADAMEQANDEPGGGISSTSSAVATQEAMQLGGFYLGLTRDDFGGLRYLYQQNNYNNETMPAGSYVSTNGMGGQWSPVGTTNTLVAGWTGTVGGVEKFTFVKVAYDSYVGFTFPSNVVQYTLPILTNFQERKIQVWRTNSAPDIIFTAANLLNGAASTDQPFTNALTFIAPPLAAINGSTAVPNVISPSNIVVFNNVGAFYYNINPNFLGNSSFFLYPYFQLGSYDGSTNAPIMFPTNTSIGSLIYLELHPPPGQTISPWNPIASTNSTTAGGTGGGTVGAGAGGGTTGAGAAVRRAGGNSP